MDIRYMRGFVAEQYPGIKWKEKVRHMSEEQIVAIYYSMVNRKNKQTKSKKEESYHQMTISEYESLRKEEDEMKVTCLITNYSNTQEIKVHSNAILKMGNHVDIEVNGKRYEVDGKELIQAIKKCMLDYPE